MDKYPRLTKKLQYEYAAGLLGIKPRLAQYIANDPKRKVPAPVEKLLEILVG